MVACFFPRYHGLPRAVLVFGLESLRAGILVLLPSDVGSQTVLDEIPSIQWSCLDLLIISPHGNRSSLFLLAFLWLECNGNHFVSEAAHLDLLLAISSSFIHHFFGYGETLSSCVQISFRNLSQSVALKFHGLACGLGNICG